MRPTELHRNYCITKLKFIVLFLLLVSPFFVAMIEAEFWGFTEWKAGTFHVAALKLFSGTHDWQNNCTDFKLILTGLWYEKNPAKWPLCPFFQLFLQSSMEVYNSDSINHDFSKFHPIRFLRVKAHNINTQYNIFFFTSHYLAYIRYGIFFVINFGYTFNQLLNLCSSFSSHLGGC